MRAVLTLVLTLAIIGCSRPLPRPPPFITPGRDREAYAIDLPEGFKLVKGAVEVDFRIDRVMSGETTYVNIYVGNFSGFSDRGPSEGVIRSGNPQTFTKAGEATPSEWLWKTDYTHPHELLVWMNDGLKAEQADVAREIALSLRPTSPSDPKP